MVAALYVRQYFLFRLPLSIAVVPGTSVESARKVLARHSYKGAPVADWPVLVSIREEDLPDAYGFAHGVARRLLTEMGAPFLPAVVIEES